MILSEFPSKRLLSITLQAVSSKQSEHSGQKKFFNIKFSFVSNKFAMLHVIFYYSTEFCL